MTAYPISAYLDSIKRLEEELRRFTNTKQTAITSYWEIINARLGEKHGISADSLSHGSWDCKESPTGKCYFNEDEDPCEDDCLVCGGPEERK